MTTHEPPGGPAPSGAGKRKAPRSARSRRRPMRAAQPGRRAATPDPASASASRASTPAEPSVDPEATQAMEVVPLGATAAASTATPTPPVAPERPDPPRATATTYADDAPADAVDPVDAGDASAEPERDPRFWHRDHPVFTPLAGFFTGLLVAVAVPGVFGALLSSFLDDESVARVFPFTLAVVGVPLVLLAVPRTRRFGKYMLFGMVLTAVVVVAVAALTLWILISNDG